MWRTDQGQDSDENADEDESADEDADNEQLFQRIPKTKSSYL
ncbi:hypothetical protein [Pseudogracilibacillus sp. SO30301A]